MMHGTNQSTKLRERRQGHNEIRGTLPISEANAMRQHLDRVAGPHLAPDVSNYARGRTRVWLQHEGPLSQYRDYGPGLKDAKLWAWLEQCWTRASYAGKPDLGLALYGNIGIRPHRDATYAHCAALTVNLGAVDWGWQNNRNGQPAEHLLDWTTLDAGELLAFDCKHVHASRKLAATRWAIVLWQAKRPVPEQTQH